MTEEQLKKMFSKHDSLSKAEISLIIKNVSYLNSQMMELMGKIDERTSHTKK